MSLFELLKIELKKVKRSKIIPLLLIPPILVVISGVACIGTYMTPEYTNAWQAMFIQSALLFAYYLLPFSMVVVCIMIGSRETQNNGILKMLALPIDKGRIAFSKFLVLLSFLIIELLFFFLSFIVAGFVTTNVMGVVESVPVLYLFSWTIKLFLSMIPCVSCMWAIYILFEKPLLSMGLNLLLIIPGVLFANTPIWFAYPYCYSGYIVTSALSTITSGAETSTGLKLFPMILAAVIITIIALTIAIKNFGKKESR